MYLFSWNVWIRIKNSRFYKDKLEDTKAIALLKKGKRGLSKVKGKIVGIWKKEERFPRMLPLLEQNFYEPEAVPDYVAEAAASGEIRARMRGCMLWRDFLWKNIPMRSCWKTKKISAL